MALYNISAGTRGYAFATSNALQWTATNNPIAEEPGSGFNQNEITWIQNLGPRKLYPCLKLCDLKKQSD